MTNGSRPHGAKGRKKASGPGAGKGKKGRTATDLAKAVIAAKVKAPATRARG